MKNLSTHVERLKNDLKPLGYIINVNSDFCKLLVIIGYDNRFAPSVQNEALKLSCAFPNEPLSEHIIFLRRVLLKELDFTL